MLKGEDRQRKGWKGGQMCDIANKTKENLQWWIYGYLVRNSFRRSTCLQLF